MDIQLKRGQFYGAVNSMCVKFRGILQDVNVASKFVLFLLLFFLWMSTVGSF